VGAFGSKWHGGGYVENSGDGKNHKPAGEQMRKTGSRYGGGAVTSKQERKGNGFQRVKNRKLFWYFQSEGGWGITFGGVWS